MLQHRVIGIHSALVPSTIESVVTQLLYLQMESPKEEITIHINSSGANVIEKGHQHSFDLQAFAIVDMILTTSCPVRTICVGEASGFAALVLSLGRNGSRFSLPNSRISFHQQRSTLEGRSYDIAAIANYLSVSRFKVLNLLSQVS